MITSTQYTEDCIAGCHTFPNETHHFKNHNSKSLMPNKELATVTSPVLPQSLLDSGSNETI